MEQRKRNPKGAGRKNRPGGWSLWCAVRAVMEVHGFRYPRQACAELYMRQRPEGVVQKVFETTPIRGDASKRRPRLLKGRPGSFKDTARIVLPRPGKEWPNRRTVDALTKEFYRV